MSIPKRIGALKLPKKVRKQAKKALKQAANPLVRDFASAAMAAANRVRREAGERKDETMRENVRIQIDGNKLGEAIRKAAAEGLKTFLEGLEEGLREARKHMDDPQAKPPKPPKPPKAAKPPKPSKAPKPPKPPKPPKARTSARSAKPAPRAPGA